MNEVHRAKNLEFRTRFFLCMFCCT